MIRAFYRSTTVSGTNPPYNTLTLKVYYPALFTDSHQERNTGVIPPDRAGAPYLVVIICPASTSDRRRINGWRKGSPVRGW
ncbi:MAG: hypothetical protein HC806_08405 [Anaerolineae bacterium]|nr:hypothetical protein [Anaerolineae bacterium]